MIVEHRWFKQLLKIQKIDKLLRHGDVIQFLPKRIIPKRIPFYFQFLPRQSLESYSECRGFKALSRGTTTRYLHCDRTA